MAACITPFVMKNKKTNENLSVPCGKCPNCTARRVSGWSFRLMQEYKQCTSAYFITLTYDTKHVPITNRGYKSLLKTDVQKFFKRLRKSHGKSNIKYYIAGEYGGKTKRPHYHVILFNANIDLIQDAWQKGYIHYGTVNEASVGYTLKYIHKPKRIPLHKNDDRQPEFALMSKGLGKNYLTENIKEWHEADMYNRMYLPLQDGKKVTMPRYYKDKLYTLEQRINIGIKARQKMLQNPINYELQAAADIAAFERQKINSLKNDKL